MWLSLGLEGTANMYKYYITTTLPKVWTLFWGRPQVELQIGRLLVIRLENNERDRQGEPNEIFEVVTLRHDDVFALIKPSVCSRFTHISQIISKLSVLMRLKFGSFHGGLHIHPTTNCPTGREEEREDGSHHITDSFKYFCMCGSI